MTPYDSLSLIAKLLGVPQADLLRKCLHSHHLPGRGSRQLLLLCPSILPAQRQLHTQARIRNFTVANQ
jgi:hypothetical protein